MDVCGERRRVGKHRQAKGQRAQQDEPHHGPVISRVFERVERDEVEDASAQCRGHEFGDVNRQVPESSHRGERGFQRDDGDERDQDLRLNAGGRAQDLLSRVAVFRGQNFCKGGRPFCFSRNML
jgi:hypothetical protein